MTADELDRFITIADAAKRLCISRSTAYRLIDRKKFPVPVRTVGSKQVVSLRLVTEHINSLDAVAS